MEFQRNDYRIESLGKQVQRSVTETVSSWVTNEQTDHIRQKPQSFNPVRGRLYQMIKSNTVVLWCPVSTGGWTAARHVQ